MQRLFDIKKTQLEMVIDRGYNIPVEEEAIPNMNLNQFVNYVAQLMTAKPRVSMRSLLSRFYEGTNLDGSRKTILVYYGGKTTQQQTQVSADVARDFINLIQRYGNNEGVLILDAHLSSTGQTELNSLPPAKRQVFFDSELTYNPTRHVDTPRHELLSPAEANAKLRQLGVDRAGLLIIKSSDPVVRYYGWPTGGIVRVHRVDDVVSILAPASINYRVIID